MTLLFRSLQRYSRLGKDLFLLAFDTLMWRPPNRERKKVLIVVRLDAIGDFVIWQTYASAIRAGFPDFNIVLVGNVNWVDLARELPYWDTVFPVDTRLLTKDLRYRARLMRKIRDIGASIVLHPTFSTHFSISDAVVRMSGASTRIGFRGDASNMHPILKSISNRFYTSLVEPDMALRSELQRSFYFMTKVCGPTLRLPRPHLDVVLPETSRVTSEPYFVLFPGAGSPGRRWPLERFAEIGRRLVKTTGLLPVICGGNEDRETADQLARIVGSRALNLAGQTSLSELVVTIKNATLVICNETSASHIAAAVGTPVVCTLGGGHYGRFLPYDAGSADRNVEPVSVSLDCFNCNWVCKFAVREESPKPCIDMIDVESVWQATLRLLEKRR
jgi:ADP-heptose:LPS heptosyltransferase